MMEPMKYELEELLYQMGIYLVQAGYAVVVEAAALAVEEPERLQSLTQEFYGILSGGGQAVPVHLELRGTEPPNGHGPGLGVQRSSDFGAGHAEDHSAAYGGRFPVHPAPRPAAEKEH